MERISMSIDENLARSFDQMIAARGYTSRSEAIRDLMRREVDANRDTVCTNSQCVASLSYVYQHHIRALADRLTRAQHEQHDLVMATMHIHLDHDTCLENVFLKGPIARVRSFADGIRAERGVAYGQINLITVESGVEHVHADGQRCHDHIHLSTP